MFDKWKVDGSIQAEDTNPLCGCVRKGICWKMRGANRWDDPLSQETRLKWLLFIYVLKDQVIS